MAEWGLDGRADQVESRANGEDDKDDDDEHKRESQC